MTGLAGGALLSRHAVDHPHRGPLAAGGAHRVAAEALDAEDGFLAAGGGDLGAAQPCLSRGGGLCPGGTWSGGFFSSSGGGGRRGLAGGTRAGAGIRRRRRPGRSGTEGLGESQRREQRRGATQQAMKSAAAGGGADAAWNRDWLPRAALRARSPVPGAAWRPPATINHEKVLEVGRILSPLSLQRDADSGAREGRMGGILARILRHRPPPLVRDLLLLQPDAARLLERAGREPRTHSHLTHFKEVAHEDAQIVDPLSVRGGVDRGVRLPFAGPGRRRQQRRHEPQPGQGGHRRGHDRSPGRRRRHHRRRPERESLHGRSAGVRLLHDRQGAGSHPSHHRVVRTEQPSARQRSEALVAR